MSLISLAPNHCRTAHASTSSGATIVQNINLTLVNSPPIRLCGGTFGWTDVHAQIKTVKIQLHATLNSVLGRSDLVLAETISVRIVPSSGEDVMFGVERRGSA